MTSACLKNLAWIGVASVLALASSLSCAESYPSRPVKIVVPYTAGGPVDQLARGLAERLGKSSGQLRAIGIVGPRRVAALPDVPTLAEEGLLGVDAAVWFALVAPAATPPEVVAKLNREVVKAIDDPAMKARFNAMAMELGSSSPQGVVDLTNRERSKWAAVVRKYDIKVE